MLKGLRRVLNVVPIWMVFSNVQRKTRKNTWYNLYLRAFLRSEITLPLAYAFCPNAFSYLLVPENGWLWFLWLFLTTFCSSSSRRLNRTLLIREWLTFMPVGKDMQEQS